MCRLRAGAMVLAAAIANALRTFKMPEIRVASIRELLTS
jgi:hypothetical protein